MPTMTSDSKTLNNVRPRERLLQSGPAALSDAELLAIVLRTGYRQRPVLQLAQSLLNELGGLRGLLATDITQLQQFSGIGLAKACEISAMSEINKRALQQSLQMGPVMNHPHLVKDYCIARLGHLTIEHCIALYLDNQLHLITSEEVAKGTLTQASVYPRELVKSALKHHAAAIILAHNHPSGVRQPSDADLHLTQQLQRALSLVDIRLIDHLIVTAGYATSLAELGKM
ncbi:DNA repair protein RadC [Paenalcaligenes hominis]|nr:DNA repair protein RadC [Paenalcaligenes hominis]